MLKLQVFVAGDWYDLLVPPEVKWEVRKILNLKWSDYCDKFFDVKDCPELAAWMQGQAYRQVYVKVIHIPDVSPAPFRQELSLHNIEEEMKKLKERIQQNVVGDFDDVPDYAG